MITVLTLLVALILGFASCQGGVEEIGSTSTSVSRAGTNASVTGTVTYRERLTLTAGATLAVVLRDVSYADAAAPLIASHTITNPGHVPIQFKVDYNQDDIDPRNTYSVSARIIESDGRLAFTNDTVYDVITRGNPNRVDMLLVQRGTDHRYRDFNRQLHAVQRHRTIVPLCASPLLHLSLPIAPRKVQT